MEANANLGDATKRSDVFQDGLNLAAEEKGENVDHHENQSTCIPLKTEIEQEPRQESVPKHSAQQCSSHMQSNVVQNETLLLKCKEFISSDSQEEHTSTNITRIQSDRQAPCKYEITMKADQNVSQYVAITNDTKPQVLCEPCKANEKSRIAIFFCAECENECLCDVCGKQHNLQKLTLKHKLQDICKYMEETNREISEKHKLCEPCAANKKPCPAFYFCADCENEFLCETCGKHHTLQKSTRNHELQDIKQYMKDAENEVIDTHLLCEPCLANGKSNFACCFCAECENEILCETCCKHHTLQKSTRMHSLRDISYFIEVKNDEVKNNKLMCEPCKGSEKISFACYFCAECENEFLCETCGTHHTLQKSTRKHKLQDISKYVQDAKTDVIENQKMCEPCLANKKTCRAYYVCAECEYEFLCDSCGKHHNLQKSTRLHKLQDLSHHMESSIASKNPLFCEPCKSQDKSSPVSWFCAECDNELLCEQCGKYHISRKSTRGHTLKNVNHYMENAIDDIDVQRRLICEPCKAQAKTKLASWFCTECDNEMLCEECGIYHKANKLFRMHSLQPIKCYSNVNDTDKNLKLCGPCSVLEKKYPAVYFCVDCENELLCENCGKYHTLQKCFRKHALQKIDSRQFTTACSSDSVDLESTPGQPTPTKVGSDSIILSWTKPALFKEGDHFQIACRENKDPKWKICYDNVEKNTFELGNLKSGTPFLFRIRAIYTDYESNYSKESEAVTTLKSPASQIVDFSIKCSAGNQCPSQYALPMGENKRARNTQGKSRKFEIGSESRGSWQQKTILLIGETGTGKSTLVDSMANYILGVNWNDPFRFTMINLEDEERDKQKNQAVSQTEWITSYSLHPQNGGRLQYTINIIDTPGFGDTRGIQRDHEIVDQIRELFTVKPPQGVTTIDCVCFLIKAPDARLTATQSYIFQSIMSLFGKDIEENICSLITFADGLEPPVIAALKESKLPFGKWFTFNNSALFAKNTDLDSSSMSPMFWDMGLKSFRIFFTHLETLPAKSLQLTSDVLNERHRLEATVRNLEPLLDAGLVKINTLNGQIKCFEENKSIIADNKNFTYTVQTTKHLKKDLPVGQHVTNCTHCNFTCHETCKIPNDADKRKCWAMDKVSGNCKICPNNCFWDQHVNTPYIFEYVVVDQQQTYAEMKLKYEEASGRLLNQEQLIAEIKADLNTVVETVDEMMEAFNESKARLSEIALRPNPLTMTEHIDLLIENEKMAKKTGWLERIKTLQMFRKRAEIDENVNQFRKQATNYVTVTRKPRKDLKKGKNKPNLFVRAWNHILK
ncbi:uncharacterized protein LOC127846398 [Dreissena polymorpha]|uniref:Fibronectin type-III domain-containing protein n=1 Tax=Dreissena polymorpha TaxID=45954 RepID=A0A9D4E4Z5_DREPO|nr:uncharacterized protein LOC127846398 [Dreissena polymorpha]XP_052233574.1 uncharacterized protein LOC127846398 [Dreissena polymorpha]KAH3772289.1 hypothetical protein DPMN_173627 [Dreissena polymorpha]